MTHTHSGDGTVPGLHGEPIPTPVLGCPACATVHSIGDELGAAPAICRHCGYFIQYEVPKAPAVPGWVHTGHSPTPPVGPPCDHPEPA